ncbi:MULTISPECIES: nuclear transport factor 2 family protein [Actinoalloteichus]|uniref:SnoaL-like domain-containing protein n=1 Tax=Actinoalloteichus fjordicus TaxID=1612552 RepID=A0AAC9LHH1_9PSEU|nr:MULTISPECIES: nuclear transport factor 2 family protein [Actinoalloteichus]APU17426.1 hypothetical protein UA74_27115 [Actinoalloteichus fjordicus]APU23512.1 hypothetical protein UA75_27705 [Actinoalloteichus sp. GBA129-24]
MTTPSALDVFRQALTSLQTGEVQAWLDLCTEDVVFEFPFARPGQPRSVEGRQALGEYLTGVMSRTHVDGLSSLETHQTLNPDVAIIEMTATGTVAGTGEPYQMSYVVVLTVRDGLIARYRDYWNPLDAPDQDVVDHDAADQHPAGQEGGRTEAMRADQLSGRVLVTGASGTTGSRVAARLAARGLEVISANRAGIGPAGTVGTRFDWHDASTHPDALVGVDRMYLVAPGDDGDPQAVMLPFLKLARDAGVRRVVLLSTSVVAAGGPGPGIVHEAVAEIFDEWAVLRPSWFMQNVLGDHVHAQSIRADSVITTAAGNGRVGFIDADDIARVGVEALLSPTPLNTDLILTGPAALSYDDVAAILTEVSGLPITHVTDDADKLRVRFEAVGVNPMIATFLAQLDVAIAGGIEDRTTDTVLRVTGTAPRSFREFAAAEFRL